MLTLIVVYIHFHVATLGRACQPIHYFYIFKQFTSICTYEILITQVITTTTATTTTTMTATTTSATTTMTTTTTTTATTMAKTTLYTKWTVLYTTTTIFHHVCFPVRLLRCRPGLQWLRVIFHSCGFERTFSLRDAKFWKSIFFYKLNIGYNINLFFNNK